MKPNHRSQTISLHIHCQVVEQTQYVIKKNRFNHGRGGGGGDLVNIEIHTHTQKKEEKKSHFHTRKCQIKPATTSKQRAVAFMNARLDKM